jgi:hypothetical protein
MAVDNHWRGQRKKIPICSCLTTIPTGMIVDRDGSRQSLEEPVTGDFDLFMPHNDTNKDDCRPRWQSTIIGGASNSEIPILFTLHNDTAGVIADSHAVIFNKTLCNCVEQSLKQRNTDCLLSGQEAAVPGGGIRTDRTVTVVKPTRQYSLSPGPQDMPGKPGMMKSNDSAAKNQTRIIIKFLQVRKHHQTHGKAPAY